VVPDDLLRSGKVAKGALREQFVRTPYAVSFQAAGQTFILITLHVIWGSQKAERTPELAAIAGWLADWAARVEDFNQNLIALGDFNIDREGDPNWEAFTSRGLSPPAELAQLPRTVSDLPGKEHFYDQIAWFHEDGRGQLTLEYSGRAGNFKWTDYLYTDLPAGEKSWHISDHYPLWVEFTLPR